MSYERQKDELRDLYRHPGFSPSRKVEFASWDKDARIISLTRRSKKLFAMSVRPFIEDGMTVDQGMYGIYHAAMLAYSLSWTCDA